MEEYVKNQAGQTLEEFLADYDETRYRRPSVTADMAVVTAIASADNTLTPAVLLIRRGNHPFLGKWALPGGFVEYDEDTLQAAHRELEEETGLHGLTLREYGVFGAPGRDPRTRIITVAHYAIAPVGSIAPKAGDDAADAALFSVSLKLLAQSAQNEVFRMTLSGPETLQVTVKRSFDELGARVLPCPDNTLAGDHAQVLFAALCAIEAQPRQRIANLLAGSQSALLQPATKALDWLFASFL